MRLIRQVSDTFGSDGHDSDFDWAILHALYGFVPITPSETKKYKNRPFSRGAHALEIWATVRIFESADY